MNPDDLVPPDPWDTAEPVGEPADWAELCRTAREEFARYMRDEITRCPAVDWALILPPEPGPPPAWLRLGHDCQELP